MEREIHIKKADGTLEAFQPAKLEASLRRAGAGERDIEEIVREIEKGLAEGDGTDVIYRKAFELLRQVEKLPAARYSLRRAMVDLGPTGFPFEDYLAKLFAYRGYEAHTRTIVPGKCVPHEIDVIARKGDECIAAEAKFHAQPGTKSDLQVVLYSYARFLDIRGVRLPETGMHPITGAMVITNTKFTTAAIDYGACMGLELLSWSYPRKGNLQDLIEESKLYPVTVLGSLSQKDKQSLLEGGTVLCKDIAGNQEALAAAGVTRPRMQAAMDESARLCAIE